MSIFEKFSLKDRVAVVTGGAGQLGAEFSRTLAEAGAAVVVADIRGRDAEATSDAITTLGHTAAAYALDVTDPASCRGLAEEVVRRYGRLDVLVNCAALDPKFDAEAMGKGIAAGAFEDFPLEKWNAALAVNLTGVFLVTQACIGPMLEGDASGSIINICSTYGLNGPDQRIYIRDGKRIGFKPAYYTVTKAGVLGFTRYLAAYYAGTRIRVNALTPGGVFNEHADDFVANYSSRTILGRMARRDEMNGALLFLASEASSYMTGANLVVDGGWTAW